MSDEKAEKVRRWLRRRAKRSEPDASTDELFCRCCPGQHCNFEHRGGECRGEIVATEPDPMTGAYLHACETHRGEMA